MRASETRISDFLNYVDHRRAIAREAFEQMLPCDAMDRASGFNTSDYDYAPTPFEDAGLSPNTPVDTVFSKELFLEPNFNEMWDYDQ